SQGQSGRAVSAWANPSISNPTLAFRSAFDCFAVPRKVPPTPRSAESSMPDPYTAIQIVMMPRDTNPHGTIFGGVILSYIDMAGATAARREVVLRGGAPPIKTGTVALNRVELQEPVLVGRVGRFETTGAPVDATSLTIHVKLAAEMPGKYRRRSP